MNAFKDAILRKSIFTLLLALLCAPVAAGDVEEKRDLERNFPGRVYLYETAPDQVSLTSPRDLIEDADAIPWLLPFGRGMSSGSSSASGGSQKAGLLPGVGSEQMKLLGRALDEGGMSRYVAALGNHTYLGTTGSLQVFDVSDPAEPEKVHEIEEACAAVHINGTLLGATLGDAGAFTLLDLTDPALPVELSRVLPPENFFFQNLVVGDALGIVTGVGVVQDFGWAAILQVIDISDPTAPVVISTMLGMDDRYRGMLIDGTTLYVAVQYDGIAVFDLSTPMIKQIGFVNAYEFIDGMVLENGYLYCAGNGLEVVDVSDPTDPEVVSQIGGAYTSDIRLGDNVAFITDDDDRSLRVIDVTDPLNPFKIHYHPAFGRCYGLDLVGDTVYLADDVYGLIVMDVTNPDIPVKVSTTSTGYFTHVADVEGDQAAVTVNQALVFTLDVSDPFAPSALGFHEPVPDTTANNTLWQMGINLEGDLALASWWNDGVSLYDVTDPNNPDRVGEALFSGSSNPPVTLVEGYLYTGAAELLVFDITDPTNPVQIATGPSVDGYITDFKFFGTTGFLAGWSEVVVLDLTDPANPVEVTRLVLNEAIKGMAIQDELLSVYIDNFGSTYLYSSELWVYDISNPTAPVQLSTLTCPLGYIFVRPGGCSVAADKNRIFVCATSILMVYNVEDPLNPFLEATYPETHVNETCWSSFEGVCTANDLIYLAGRRGVEILRMVDVGIFLNTASNPAAASPGESVTFEVKVKNFAEETKNLTWWMDDVFPEGGVGPFAGPGSTPMKVTLKPGQEVILNRQQNIPAGTPAGTYHLNAHVCDEAGVELDNDRITVEVGP